MLVQPGGAMGGGGDTPIEPRDPRHVESYKQCYVNYGPVNLLILRDLPKRTQKAKKKHGLSYNAKRFSLS